LSSMAFWNAVGVILMLVSLRNLGVKIQETLVNWVNLNEFVE
jgi:hypothetical protein